MIEIKFTKEQYENLIKMVYLGNWMINAIRVHGEEHEKYNEMAQYIYSFAKDADLENLIEHDSELNKFYPTTELEEEGDMEEFRQEYDNEIFWGELIDRLSRRDFIRGYGEKTIRKMAWEERLEKEHPFIDKYEEEFEKYGIENLEISDRDRENK